MQRLHLLLFQAPQKQSKIMKHLLLTGLLLSGACLTAQAQGGYQDDVYSSAPVLPSGGSGNSNSNSSGNQQRPDNGSFDNRNSSDNGYNNGNSNNGYSNSGNYNDGNTGYGNSYADDYDYIDYQNDAYYSNRFRRFNDPFYNVGYWSSFWGPGYGGYGGYGGFGGYGYGFGGPGINISIGYGGPYWSSAWGWNNWYGYGGFSSYWNYPYYAGGWGGNPWLGGYGQGYNNGYWNGYYAGLYGAGTGYGNGYNAGYRNVTYGPRDGGLNGGYSGYRNRLSGTDGYRQNASGGRSTNVPGITDGGRRVPVNGSGVAPVRNSNAAISPGRTALDNNANSGRVITDRATLNTTDRNPRINNGATLSAPGGSFGEAAPRDRIITRDGAGNMVTESPARINRTEGNNADRINSAPVRAPQGGWFEGNSDRRVNVDRQQSVQEAAPRNNAGNNGAISDRATRSFDQQQPQRNFDQPRYQQQPQRSFEQQQSQPQRNFEQPRYQPQQQPQRSFEQPQQMQQPQRSFEQPRQAPQQRSFEQPRMSAPSRSFSTPSAPSGGGFRGGGGGGGSFGGGMRR
jgi:hypothetical protein